jgi:hypothetical protein
MALVYNPLPQTVSVQVCGNYFEFKPEQVKLIHNENIAHIMVTDKAYEGLVSVPDVCVEAPHSEESKQIKLEAKKQGIAARISHLEKIKYNLLVSLRHDIDVKNLKIDPLTLASSGEKKALKELSLYHDINASTKEQEVEELRKLTEKLGGNTI